MNISDSELFAQIKAGNESAVEIVYKLHRAKFTSWALSKFKVSSQDAEDVWQDTIIVFFENVKNGKLLVLNSKLGTYLFAIGKYILLNKLKKNQKMEFPGSFEEENFGSNELQDFDFQLDESDKTLKPSFEQFGNQCKELLIKRFYLEQSVEEITLAFKFSNKNVASASLSRCLSQLRKIISISKKGNDDVE